MTRIETIPNVELGVEVVGAIAKYVLLEIAPTGTDKDTTRETGQLVCIVALIVAMVFESALTRPVTGASIDATSGRGGGGGALGVMLGDELEDGDVLPLSEAVTVNVYAVPLVNPVIVQDDVATVHVKFPGEEVTV